MFIGVWLKGKAFLSQDKSIDLSTNTNGEPSPDNFVMFFENIEESKLLIYSNLRKKSGVYMFINNITKDLYIGSSINLTNSMTNHFYHGKSETRGKTSNEIRRAMYKYKMVNFSLGLIEFCERDAIVCTTLEQK